MWLSLTSLAVGLTFSQTAHSKTHFSRQEACNSVANNAAYAACAMQAAFGGSAIVPQLFPAFSPKAALKVTYGNVVIGGAQQLSPAKVYAPPVLSLSFVSSSSQAFQQLYATIGLDYEPQSQQLRFFWLQPAMEVDAATGLLSSSIPPIVPYTSPNPLKGTGTHEFILFAFADNGILSAFRQNPQLASISTAADFQTFLSITKLNNQLVAGSYFKSTYDSTAINAQSTATSGSAQIQTSSVSSQSSISSTSNSAKPQAQSSIQTTSTPAVVGNPGAPAAVISPSTTTGSTTPTVINSTSASQMNTSSDHKQQDEPISLATLVKQNHWVTLMSIFLTALLQL